MIKELIKKLLQATLSKERFEQFALFIYHMRQKYLRILLIVLSAGWIPKFIPRIFSSNGIKVRKFHNGQELLSGDKKVRQVLLDKKSSLYFSGPSFSIDSMPGTLSKSEYAIRIYGVILSDVHIIGGSSIILLDKDRALYDLKYHDFANKFWYTDEAILSYNNVDVMVRVIESDKNIEKAISLVANYSSNYYHLLYELAVKFEQINALNVDPDIPILVDQICFDIPQYIELLNVLNTKKRRMIYIQKGASVSVSSLYYFSSPNIIPPNFHDEKSISAQDILFSLGSLEFLKASLMPHISQKEFPGRVFISRAKASGRRTFNEDEVFEYLETYSFQRIFIENYSIAEQIAIFYNAEIIVGGSGAAFTNLLFCNTTTKSIIISNNELPFSGFSSIASFVKCPLIYYAENSDLESMKTLHDNFIVDLSLFNAFFQKLV